MKRLLIILAVLLLSPPAYGAEEGGKQSDDENGSPEYYMNKTEWITLKLLGGNYGVGGSISFFTLRKTNFYWEILRFSGAYGGPGFGSGTSYFWTLGTIWGGQIFLTDSNRHELRIGGGFFFGPIGQELYEPIVEKEGFCSNENSGNCVTTIDEGLSSIFSIVPTINYVYHCSKVFTFLSGLDLYIPVTKIMSRKLPDMPIMASFGVAF